MDETEVILRLFLPADEQLATSVEPGGHAFHHPAPGASPAAARAPFLAAAPNVRDVAAATDRPLGINVVVAFVQTEMLRDGAGRADDARVEQQGDGFLVGAVSGSEGNRDREAGTVGEMVARGAGLGAIGRVGTGFSPAQRGFAQRRIGGLPFPLETDRVVVVVEQQLPDRCETAARDSALKPAMHGGPGGSLSGHRLPLTAGAQDVPHAVENLARGMPVAPPCRPELLAG